MRRNAAGAETARHKLFTDSRPFRHIRDDHPEQVINIATNVLDLNDLGNGDDGQPVRRA